jgi:hypothetical protein
MSKADEPAFPQLSIYGGMITPGLTKREYFAAHMMPVFIDEGTWFDPALAAKKAVSFADALLRALERKPE